MQEYTDKICEGVYFLPERERFIFYAPLQGLLLEVNDAYKQCFHKALNGDVAAAKSIGLSSTLLEDIQKVPASTDRILKPVWPVEFRPTNMTIFLTHQCTLRCSYCYCYGGEGVTMSWDMARNALDYTMANAKKLGQIFKLSFHGGDPGACWPLFQKCVRYIEKECADMKLKFQLSVGTNAFYNEQQANFISKHIHSATVSLDGIPDIHNRYRCGPNGEPSLSRILPTLQIFEKNKMQFSVRMTVTRGSVDKLSESVEYICQKTKAGNIRAEPMYTRGRASSANLSAPDAAVFVKRFREAKKIAKKYGRELTYSGARIGGVYGTFCSYPNPTFGVTPEGGLTCCYEVLHPQDSLGEVFYYGSISENGVLNINQERINAIRNMAVQRREKCGDCFCLFQCAGDCIAKVNDAGGLNTHVAERCFITRELTKDMLKEVLAGKWSGKKRKEHQNQHISK